MSKGVNSLLRNEHLTANRAMLTGGKSCFGTIRSNGCIDYLCMRLLFNRFCSSTDFFSTYGAINNAFIRTCNGAGRVNNVFFYGGRFCVTELFNHLLRYGNGVTYCTLLTLGKTCFSTCGRYCGKNLLGVTKSRNLFSGYCNFSTYCTLLTFCKTCFGTCRCY